jgi:TorA maturation chaperone TorD
MDHAMTELEPAAIYDGFATLFSEPLDAASIALCRARSQVVALGSLDRAAWACEPPGREALGRVLRIIAGTGDSGAITSLLNRDFGTLFLGIQGPDRVVATCRSAYVDNGLDAAVETETLLADCDFAVAARFVEPADHIAIELALMARLLHRGHSPGDRAAVQPTEFLDLHLLNWIPAFSARCAAADRTGCYAGLAAMLHGFLLHERSRLATAGAPTLTAPSNQQ